jgi:hypothetical protein
MLVTLSLIFQCSYYNHVNRKYLFFATTVISNPENKHLEIEQCRFYLSQMRYQNVKDFF